MLSLDDDDFTSSKISTLGEPGGEEIEESGSASYLSSVYRARPLCSSLQPRQFEFHPYEKIMAVGTCEGDVVILDWENNKILQRHNFNEKEEDREPRSILALSWLRVNQNLLLAGSSSGKAKLYKFKENDLSVAQVYEDTLTEEMTSIHCNCTDQRLAASGYTNDVKIFDLYTGKTIREYKHIHSDHINICRFANHLPDLLLTCSFDNTIKLWDNRCRDQKPIHVSKSDGGNVMVCFSPDDIHFLVSAVDNEVKQYTTVDGRLHLKYDIQPIQSSINYTRSYYANGGDVVVSGSSNDDVVNICCSNTGKVVRSINMYEGRRHPNLYVQSLRGNPIVSNRFGVLVCYRYADSPYEVVDVDLNQNVHGSAVQVPYSIGSEAKFSFDLSRQIHSQLFCDLVLVSSDGVRVRAHRAVLNSRWPWFRKNHGTVSSPLAHESVQEVKLKEASSSVCSIIHYIYTGKLKRTGTETDKEGSLTATFMRNIKALFRLCKPERYDLPGICDLIQSCLRDRINLSNTIEILQFASGIGAESLLEKALDFLLRSFQYFERTIGLNRLEKRVGRDVFSKILSARSKGKHKPSREPYFIGRTAHTTTQIGRWLYLLGGYYSKGTQDPRCVPVFDSKRLEWTLLPTYGEDSKCMPEKLCFHTTCAVGDMLLAFGGGLKDDFRNDLHFLNLKSMTWEQHEVGGIPPCERKRHSAVTIGTSSEMWVFGGRVRGTENKRLVNDLHKFDLDSMRWSEVKTFGEPPSPRCGHTMTYLPHLNKIIIIGGFTCTGLTEEGMLHALDLATMRWEEIMPPSPCPVPRCCHTATVIEHRGDTHIAIFGGSTSQSNWNKVYLADTCLLSYGPSKDEEDEAAAASRGSWRWEFLVLDERESPPARFTHSAFLTFDEGQQASSELGGAELKTTTKGLSEDKQVNLRAGRLTIWAGGNNEEFLDDMWHFDWNDMKWKQTRCTVAGSMPEPKLDTRGLTVSMDMKLAFLSEVRRKSSQVKKVPEGLLRGENLNNSRCPRSLPSSSSNMEEEEEANAVVDDLQKAGEAVAGVGLPPIQESVSKTMKTNTKEKEEKKKKEDTGPVTTFDFSFGSGFSVIFVVEDCHIVVSKFILAARSKQFRTMFTSRMSESREKIIQLPDVRLNVFLFILYYIYSGDLPTSLTPTSGGALRTCTAAARPSTHDSSSVSSNSSHSNSIRWPFILFSEQHPFIGRDREEDTKGTMSSSSSPFPLLEEDIEATRASSRKRKGPSSMQRKPKRGLELATAKLGSSTTSESRSQKVLAALESTSSARIDCKELKQVLIDTVVQPPKQGPYTEGGAGDEEEEEEKEKEDNRFIDPLEVLVAADRFALDELTEILETAVSKYVTASNAGKILKFADFYNLNRLAGAAIMHLITTEDIKQSKIYKNSSARVRKQIDNWDWHRCIESLVVSHSESESDKDKV